MDKQENEMERINQIIRNACYQYHQGKVEEAEKDRIFCKHGKEHALDVARIMYIQVLEQAIPIKKDIVYATALLHDIGRWEQYEKQVSHHEAGARIAEHILSECGYDEEEISMMMDAISAHQTDKSDDKNVLSRILYKADKISRACYACPVAEACYWEDAKKNKTIHY